MMNFFMTIILACVAYFCVRAVWRSIKSDARTHDRVNTAARDAAFDTLSKGNFRYPSWHNDPSLKSMFMKRIIEQLSGKVPSYELEAMAKVEWFHSCVATIADAYETRGYKFSEQIVLTSDVLQEIFEKGLYKRFQQSEVQPVSESEFEKPRAEPKVDTPVIKKPDAKSKADNRVYSRPGPAKTRVVKKPDIEAKPEQEIKLKRKDPGVVLADTSNQNVNYRVVVLEDEGKAVSAQVEAPSNDHLESTYRIAPADDDK